MRAEVWYSFLPFSVEADEKPEAKKPLGWSWLPNQAYPLQETRTGVLPQGLQEGVGGGAKHVTSKVRERWESEGRWQTWKPPSTWLSVSRNEHLRQTTSKIQSQGSKRQHRPSDRHSTSVHALNILKDMTRFFMCPFSTCFQVRKLDQPMGKPELIHWSEELVAVVGRQFLWFVGSSETDWIKEGWELVGGFWGHVSMGQILGSFPLLCCAIQSMGLVFDTGYFMHLFNQHLLDVG